MNTIYIVCFEGRAIGSISSPYRITTSAPGETEEIAKENAKEYLSRNNEIFSFISIETAASVAKRYDAARMELFIIESKLCITQQ
jgi:hypothetical protein